MAIKPMTAEQKTNYINTLTNYYNTMYKTSGKKIPKNIIDYAIAHQFSTADFKQYVISNDKAWDSGPTAVHQRQMAIEMLTATFGSQVWRKDREIVKLVKAFGHIADTGKLNQAVRKLFLQKVATSEKFIAKNPGFAAWWKTHGAGQPNQFDPAAWKAAYNADVVSEREDFQAAYAGLVSPTAVMPEELFWKAFNGGWKPNDSRFLAEIQSSPAWGGAAGAQKLAQDFTENWHAIFGPDKAPDPNMLAAYTKSNGNFVDFFHSSIKNSTVFKNAFSKYADWESKAAREKGVSPTELDIFTYFADEVDAKNTERSYINDYKELFGPDANPNAAWLARAVAEKWSMGVWHNYILKNDPNASTTDEYKRKAEDFGVYYRGVFGEDAVADPSLLAEYVASGSGDPLTMWDKIKQTSQFRQQYANWDVFSAAQEAQGNVVMEDPQQYKEYQRGMEDAFARIGMPVPAGMVRQVFASGIDTQELGQNLKTYDEDKASYDWQTGQQADLGTAAGIGDRPAGGDLRKRMESALAQHRTYAGSKFNQYDVDKKNDMMIKKI